MFRILTEDVNREGILALVSAKFDAFAVLPSIGYWKGTRENSLAIEIATPTPDLKRAVVFALALEIKLLNKQDAVLVQELQDTASLV